jgi:Protein CHAPERONE-LIKE PROTEIN OF POR1-like
MLPLSSLTQAGLVVAWIVLCAELALVEAFSLRQPNVRLSYPQQLRPSLTYAALGGSRVAAMATPGLARGVTSPLAATMPVIALPNPFKKLPWNVKKELERQTRRRNVERAKLHRQLGIAEDATYEEIVEATDRLIRLAGSDLKAKVQVEVAKDKILQHRLNERLAGLQAESREARAMSTYEIEG